MTPQARRILAYGGGAAVLVLAAALGTFAALSLRPGHAIREVAIPAEIANPPAPPAKTVPAGRPAAQPPRTGGGPPAVPSPPAAPPGPAAMAPAPDKAAPSFDVVRVERSGENVVAGRAAPDSKVDLLANGRVAESTTADSSGEFVMTPPALKPGSHELTLRSTDAAGHAVVSRRSVVVSVPSKPGEQLLVVAQEPGKPAEILNAGKPVAAVPPGKPVEVARATPPVPSPPAAGAARPAAPGQQVATLEAPPAAVSGGTSPSPHIDAVETDAGRLFVQGTGAPGARLGIYLNDTHIADAVVGSDRHWTLTVKRGLTPGNYEVRVDQIGRDGKVAARAAVPFDYRPGTAVAAAAPTAVAPKRAEAAPPVAAGEMSGPQTASTASPPPAGPTAAAEVVPPAPSQPPVVAAGPAANPTSAAVAPRAAPAATGAPRANMAATQPPAVAPSAGAPAAPTAPAAPALSAAPVAPGATANPVVEWLGTVSVVRGDSLWRISRTIYGHGIRYTVIYAANEDQIRDPDLIYPGQVFVIPPPQPGAAPG